MTTARHAEKYFAQNRHGKKLLRKETQEMIAEALRPVKKEANK
jgi:hypothetical protein